MCIDSGVWLMKSKMRFGSWRNVTGSGLSAVDDVRKFDRVADEEDRQVVADEVPVAVLGIELDGKSARIARDFGRIAAADDGRKANRERRLLPLLLEQLGARVLRRRLVADHARRFELAVADEPARVHDPLRDALAIEVADLFEEVVVLQRGGPAAAHRPLRLVVRDRMSLPRRQRLVAGQILVLLHACSENPFVRGGTRMRLAPTAE